MLSSCSSEIHNNKPLTIATNSWIGYAPLFYAQEKGYLEKNNIKLLVNVSLAEAAELYSVGKADMVTTTQHEYYAFKEEFDLVPVILLDRSNGGDMILSNKSVAELQKADSITAYLEVDSINAEILKDFIKLYNIPLEKLHMINKDQAQIEDIQLPKNEAVLIVTYVPYNINLEKKGFKVIASTKDINSIIVIDALCTSKTIFNKRLAHLKTLKAIIDRSVEELMKDKKSSYLLVKKYLGDLSYKEYLESLQTITWINKPSQELLDRIEPLGYERRYILP
jgi:NitT/TauT family transport system substrate-binding protein